MKIRYSTLAVMTFIFVQSLSAQPAKLNELFAKQDLLKHDTDKVIWHYDVSTAYRMTNADSSIHFATKALSLALAKNFSRGIGLAYSALAVGHSIKGDFREAEATCLKAIEIHKKYAPQQLAMNYTHMGIILQRQARFNEGIQFQHKALQVAMEYKDSSYLSKIYNNLGIAYTEQGDYLKAIDYRFRFLKLSEQLKDSTGIAIALGNISGVLKLQKDYRGALSYNLKSLEIHNRLNNKGPAISTYNTIASIYGEMGEGDKEIKYYQKALSLAHEMGSEIDEGVTLANMGQAYLRQKDYNNALKNLTRSSLINDKANNRTFLSATFIALSQLYREQGNAALQKEYALKGLAIAMKEGLKPQIRDASEMLYLFYKAAGNSKGALNYHEIFTSYKDSLFNAENVRQVKAAEFKYAVEGQEKEIQLLQKNNELRKRENSLQRIYLAGSFILFLTAFAFILYYVHQIRIKNRLYHSLEKQKKEIEEQNQKISEQTKNLEELNGIKNKIISVMSHDVKSPVASLEMILSMAEAEDDPGIFRSMIKDVKTSVHSLSLLLENILGWAKSQMQKGEEVQITPVDACSTAREIISLYEATAAQKDISLRNEIPENTWIKANKDYLNLILRNLISNAIKFSPSGELISVSAATSGNEIAITVSDKGFGMTDQEMAKLFNVKSLYTSNGTKNEKGTGLGLIFVKESVEKFGGRLSIKSEKHKGSQFICHFEEANTDTNLLNLHRQILQPAHSA